MVFKKVSYRISYRIYLILILLFIGVLCDAVIGVSVVNVKAEESTSSVELEETMTTVMENPSKITFDVVDVDIRDALSTLAISMGASILYIDQEDIITSSNGSTPQVIKQDRKVTLHIENTPPLKVMELILEKEGLSYLYEGNLIIVGKEADLQSNFFNRMLVTKFNLNYITADKFEEQLSKLGLPMKTMSVAGNSRSIWIQATPKVLAKVREVINALDVPENAISNSDSNEISIVPYKLTYVLADRLVSIVDAFNLDVRTIAISENEKVVWAQGTQEALRKFENLLKQLDVEGHKAQYEQIAQINLKYIDSDKIESVVQKIEMSDKIKIITLEENKQSFWAIGSSKAISDLRTIVKQLDIVDNIILDPTKSLTQIKLNYISADKVRDIIVQSGLKVNVFIVTENRYSLWVQGTDEETYAAENLVSNIDIESNRSDLIVFAYTLNNITAEQAIEGITKMALNDVRTIAVSPKVSKSLLVICTEAMESTARGALFNLDMEASKILNNTAKIKVPVDHADNTNSLASRRDLISSLTGVSSSNFRISGNVSRNSGGYYILWLEDTTGNVKKVMDIIKLIDNPLDSSSSD